MSTSKTTTQSIFIHINVNICQQRREANQDFIIAIQEILFHLNLLNRLKAFIFYYTSLGFRVHLIMH